MKRHERQCRLDGVDGGVVCRFLSTMFNNDYCCEYHKKPLKDMESCEHIGTLRKEAGIKEERVLCLKMGDRYYWEFLNDRGGLWDSD